MFLVLNHKNLTVYQVSGKLVVECYRLTILLPSTERFSLVSQIRRAALSVSLNIAEGASRKSAVERKRFYEIARSSLVELDTAFSIAISLKFFEPKTLTEMGSMLLQCFKMLSKL